MCVYMCLELFSCAWVWMSFSGYYHHTHSRCSSKRTTELISIWMLSGSYYGALVSPPRWQARVCVEERTTAAFLGVFKLFVFIRSTFNYVTKQKGGGGRNSVSNDDYPGKSVCKPCVSESCVCWRWSRCWCTSLACEWLLSAVSSRISHCINAHFFLLPSLWQRAARKQLLLICLFMWTGHRCSARSFPGK